MARSARYALIAAGLFCLALAPASADFGTLTLSGWLAGGGGTYVNAMYTDASASPQNIDGLFGTGSILGHFENELPAGPLYCLDIFHSFTDVTTSWDVERMVVPPDPENPPPWNTAEAAYAYHTFKGYSYNATKAAGLQLALWEISHEQAWRSHFTYSGWYLEQGGYTSEFWAPNISHESGKGMYASQILQAVYDWNFDPTEPAGSLYYYQPTEGYPDYEGAQGFVGDVPEPGTLMMLGAGLLLGTGLAWRNRRR